MKPRHTPDRRRRDLAAIHASAKQLGLDDDTYRALLARVSADACGTAVRSAGDLTADGRAAVLAELRRLGAIHPGAHKPGRYPGTPHTIDRQPMLTRIEQLLTAMGLPWAYADRLARHMYRVDRVAWLRGSDQLQGVIAALDAEHDRRSLRAQIEAHCTRLGLSVDALVERFNLPSGWRSNRKVLGSLALALSAEEP